MKTKNILFPVPGGCCISLSCVVWCPRPRQRIYKSTQFNKLSYETDPEMKVCESALWGSVFDPNQWEWGQNGGQAQTYMPQTYSWLQGLDPMEELGGQSRFLLHLSPSGYSRRGCHIHTPTFISHWLGTVSEKIPFQVPECRKTGIC